MDSPPPSGASGAVKYDGLFPQGSSFSFNFDFSNSLAADAFDLGIAAGGNVGPVIGGSAADADKLPVPVVRATVDNALGLLGLNLPPVVVEKDHGVATARRELEVSPTL